MKPCTCSAPIVLAPSTVSEMRAVGGELFAAHFKEIALHQEVTDLCPDWHQYEALEKAGMLIALAAWHESKLVGYCVSLLIRAHLHYSGLCFAQNDVLFVHEDYRGSSACGRLMMETKRIARERGASRIQWHCKENTDLHKMLAKRKTCVVQDIIYTELL